MTTTTPDPTDSCYVPDCDVLLPNPQHLMCAEHWAQLPRPLQLEIYRSRAAHKRDGTDATRQRTLGAIHAARDFFITTAQKEKSEQELKETQTP